MPLFFSHIQIPLAVIETRDTGARRSDRLKRFTPSHCEVLRWPKHTWSLEERITLCVLKKWYSPSQEDHCLIFNAHHAVSIQDQNPGHRLRRAVLVAQLNEMQGRGEYDEAWRTVMLETGFGDLEDQWKNTCMDLEATAAEIGIELLRGWEDKHKVSTQSGRGRLSKKRKRQCEWEGVLGFVVDHNADEVPCTPRRKLHGLFTPPASPQGCVQNPQTHQITIGRRQVARPIIPTPDHADDAGLNYRFSPPELAFRFWDDNSHGLNTTEGFRAGAFINCRGNIPLPPDRNDQVFRAETNIHLRPLPEPSSYISVWESLVPALHRGLRSTANAHIAIIDLRAIYQDQLSGLPGLYPAAAAIKQLGMITDERHYRGISEWLVWGEIKRQAVLATLSVEDLRRFTDSAPRVGPIFRLDSIERSLGASEYRRLLRQSQLPLSRASGKIVGEFLAFTGLPQSLVHFAALKIARSWYFLGLRNSQRRGAYLRGVYAGYGLAVETRDDTFQVRRRFIQSITASLEVRDTDDTFEARRAFIESIMASSGGECQSSRVQAWRRRVDAIADTSEAEMGEYNFLVQRRRIEAVLESSHTH